MPVKGLDSLLGKQPNGRYNLGYFWDPTFYVRKWLASQKKEERQNLLNKELILIFTPTYNAISSKNKTAAILEVLKQVIGDFQDEFKLDFYKKLDELCRQSKDLRENLLKCEVVREYCLLSFANIETGYDQWKKLVGDDGVDRTENGLVSVLLKQFEAFEVQDFLQTSINSKKKLERHVLANHTFLHKRLNAKNVGCYYRSVAAASLPTSMWGKLPEIFKSDTDNADMTTAIILRTPTKLLARSVVSLVSVINSEDADKGRVENFVKNLKIASKIKLLFKDRSFFRSAYAASFTADQIVDIALAYRHDHKMMKLIFKNRWFTQNLFENFKPKHWLRLLSENISYAGECLNAQNTRKDIFKNWREFFSNYQSLNSEYVNQLVRIYRRKSEGDATAKEIFLGPLASGAGNSRFPNWLAKQYAREILLNALQNPKSETTHIATVRREDSTVNFGLFTSFLRQIIKELSEIEINENYLKSTNNSFEYRAILAFVELLRKENQRRIPNPNSEESDPDYTVLYNLLRGENGSNVATVFDAFVKKLTDTFLAPEADQSTDPSTVAEDQSTLGYGLNRATKLTATPPSYVPTNNDGAGSDDDDEDDNEYLEVVGFVPRDADGNADNSNRASASSPAEPAAAAAPAANGDDDSVLSFSHSPNGASTPAKQAGLTAAGGMWGAQGRQSSPPPLVDEEGNAPATVALNSSEG